jgi:hypothetical protein
MHENRDSGGSPRAISLAPIDRRQRLLSAVGQISGKLTVGELVDALRRCARSLASSDGITIVRREGNQVRYVAEDAAAPLWMGQRFPIETCISGLAMIQNAPILISDIYSDPRVPHSVYETTFVRSMAVFPIGMMRPVWAIGAYWSKAGPVDPEAVMLLSSLARSAAFAFDRIALPAGTDDIRAAGLNGSAKSDMSRLEGAG